MAWRGVASCREDPAHVRGLVQHRRDGQQEHEHGPHTQAGLVVSRHARLLRHLLQVSLGGRRGTATAPQEVPPQSGHSLLHPPLGHGRSSLISSSSLPSSSQLIVRSKNNNKTYWWGALLISVGLVVFMATFVKVCSVHTPSSNPHKPPALRITDTLRRPIKKVTIFLLTCHIHKRDTCMI